MCIACKTAWEVGSSNARNTEEEDEGGEEEEEGDEEGQKVGMGHQMGRALMRLVV